MTYSALAVVAAGLCLCAQLTLAYSGSSGSDDSIINRYISQDTGESVRSESQIPIEVDQITLVTPSMDHPNFKIVNKHRGGETYLQIGHNEYNDGEDDYMLEYPEGMRLMASYYDDDLLGGSAYRIPGLSNIFNDTGVFKKMTIESIDSTTNQVNFSATVETVQLVFGITSKNAKSYSEDVDMISQTEIGQDRCNYMDRENCEYTNIASYIQTCDIRTNASCVLFLNTTAPAPDDSNVPDDMVCMIDENQTGTWQENNIIPMPTYTAQPTHSDCRDECIIWNAQQGMDVPYICAFVNTTANPYFCFVFEKPAGDTWGSFTSCPSPSDTARNYMYTTLNDDHADDYGDDDPNTRRRRSLLEVSPPPSPHPTTAPGPAAAASGSHRRRRTVPGCPLNPPLPPLPGYGFGAYLDGDPPMTEKDCACMVGYEAEAMGKTINDGLPLNIPCTKITDYGFDPNGANGRPLCTFSFGTKYYAHDDLGYQCDFNFIPLPDQDFACPVDINIPLRNRYFDRRNDCDAINGVVETQEKYSESPPPYTGSWSENLDGQSNIQNGWIKKAAESHTDPRTAGMELIVKEACESAIGCMYDNGACRAISEGEGGTWDITKQTGKFWVSALVEVTIPADWTKGSGECKFRTFWNDGRLNKDYFDDIKTLGYSGANDRARGKMRLFFEDSFFSTTINVNPYPPFNPSPPPTPPMTNRYDLYFDYNGTGYTILGTRGAPDVSLKRYDAPIFPAGEESWVAVAGVPVATSRVDKSEVVYESINITNTSQGKNDTKSLEIIKGSEGNPEYTKDLRLVLLTDLGPEGAYELNKPLGVYQSIQFSDTFDGGSACRAPNKIFVNTTNTTNTTTFFYAQTTERYVAQPNQTCGNYNMTQTYCYSAIILNVVTGKASDRYYFNFTCPPMTAEPTMFPTFAAAGESLVPTTVPTTLAAGAEGFTESEIKKAERSIIEVVLVFCGCLAALLIAVVMVNTLMGSKRNTVDLRNLPPKDKEKVCGPPPPRYGATTVSIEAKPHQNDSVFVGNSKTLKWV